MKNFMFSIVILQTIGMTLSSQFTCDPKVDCSLAKPGTKVPDRADCQNYYICLGNGKSALTSVPCDDGKYFVTASGECEKTHQCAENLCMDGQIANTCVIDCSLPGVYNIPVAGDCSKFYSCMDPTQVIHECTPEFPYFNGELCVNDPNDCCQVCSHVCFEEYTVVADPQNCNGYVLCLPDNDYEQLSCPDAEYFNVLTNECVIESEPCSSYCPLVITSSTTSSESTIGFTSAPTTGSEISTTIGSTIAPSTSLKTSSSISSTIEPTIGSTIAPSTSLKTSSSISSTIEPTIGSTIAPSTKLKTSSSISSITELTSSSETLTTISSTTAPSTG